jgi:hypothetical protein
MIEGHDRENLSALGLDQPIADRIANQTCCFMNVPFLHEPRTVRFGRFYSDPQLHCDVFGGLAFSYQLKNLTRSP